MENWMMYVYADSAVVMIHIEDDFVNRQHYSMANSSEKVRPQK